MRYIYNGTYKDGNGKVVTEGTISVFEAGTSDVANIYIASSGGSAVNFVTSDSNTGKFSFYVDEGDYATTQKFKITLSKTDYQSQSYDDIVLFPEVTLTETQTFTNKTLITPVISDLSNMLHDHSDASNAGVIEVLSIRHQANTTDATKTGVKIQSGWGFITAGAGVSRINETVTLPTAFSSEVLSVNITWIGSKVSDPSTITDFGTTTDNIIESRVPTISLSAFTAELHSDVNFTDTVRYGYSWMVTGI